MKNSFLGVALLAVVVGLAACGGAPVSQDELAALESETSAPAPATSEAAQETVHTQSGPGAPGGGGPEEIDCKAAAAACVLSSESWWDNDTIITGGYELLLYTGCMESAGCGPLSGETPTPPPAH